MVRTVVREGASGEEPGFRREVGLLALTFVSLGSIIGSGWLLSALTAATSAGGASIISWPITGVIIVLLALVYAELGTAYPLTGGPARWPRLAFGYLGGFTAAWVAWLQAVTIAPIEVEAALDYLDHKWPGLINHVSGALTLRGLSVAVGLMTLFTVINALGVLWFTKTNGIAVAWKITVPVLVIGVLMVVSFHASNFTAGGGFAPYGLHGIFAALSLGVVFSLQGFEQAVQIAGEARDPRRNVPRAMIFAVLIGTVLYLLLEVAFVGALNPTHLIHGWTNPMRKGDFGPYATLATSLGLGWLAGILYVDAFISPADTGLVYLGTAARLSYALAQAGYLPEADTRIRNRGVPYIWILLAFAVGLIYLRAFPSWQSMIKLATAETVTMYAFAPITLLALRKTHPDLDPPPYRLPAAPILARLAFIAANEIIYWTSWTTVWKLMLAILVGYLLLGISYKYKLGRPDGQSSQHHPRELTWIILWLTGLTVISWLGQYGGMKLIPPWVDLGVVAAFSLLICQVAIQHGLPSPRAHREAGQLPIL